MPRKPSPCAREGRKRMDRALSESGAPVGEKRHLREDGDVRGKVANGAHGFGGLEQAAERLEEDQVRLGLE